MNCIECNQKMQKGGFGYSGHAKKQIYICNNKECPRFRVKTMKYKESK